MNIRITKTEILLEIMKVFNKYNLRLYLFVLYKYIK